MLKEGLHFGTSGIRGYTNTEISPELVLKVGHAFGRFLKNSGRVVVGYDTRWGSEMLAKAAATGMMSEGLDVDDLGQLPTPAFATYLVNRGYNGGIMITGSHMPPDRIGIIVMIEDGAYAHDDVARVLERMIYETEDEPYEPPHPRTIGRYQRIEDARDYYLEEVLKLVDLAAIKAKGYKILIDPGNGTACRLLARVLERTGCITVEINHTPQPEPNREAEPRARNLGPSATAVLENRCDFGVATDVDADRSLFITGDGKIISEDVMGALFAEREFAEHKRKAVGTGTEPDLVCVTPVNSSGLIEQVCAKLGVKVEYCRIGQPDTARALKEFHGQYAYEESGKYYFAAQVLWCDGLLSTLKVLELMAHEGKTLAELIEKFPVFTQVKRMVHCSDTIKDQVMTEVYEAWSHQLLDQQLKDVTIDGLKRVYKDNAWLLIRASGTEPLIRVYSDAETPERAEQLVKNGLGIVESIIHKHNS